MFKDKWLNAFLLAIFAIAFFVSLALARSQTPIGNEQFLRR